MLRLDSDSELRGQGVETQSVSARSSVYIQGLPGTAAEADSMGAPAILCASPNSNQAQQQLGGMLKP